MTSNDALEAACRHCVTSSALLAAARLLSRSPAASDREVAAVLAGSAVAGWADRDTSGRADPSGISVVARSAGREVGTVRWSDVAAVIRRGLTPQRVDRLARLYGQYVDATLQAADSRTRLAARVASAELAQHRAEILTAALEARSAQQALFELPAGQPSGRSR